MKKATAKNACNSRRARIMASTTALSASIALGLTAGMTFVAGEALALSPAGSGQAVIAQVNKTAIVPTTGSGAQSGSALAHTPAVITTQLGKGGVFSVQTLGTAGQVISVDDALTGAINTTGRNTPQPYTPPATFNNAPAPYTPPTVFNNTPQPAAGPSMNGYGQPTINNLVALEQPQPPTVFNNTPQPYTPPKVFNNTPQPYTPNVAFNNTPQLYTPSIGAGQNVVGRNTPQPVSVPTPPPSFKCLSSDCGNLRPVPVPAPTPPPSFKCLSSDCNLRPVPVPAPIPVPSLTIE